jgi:hypothetical protein
MKSICVLGMLLAVGSSVSAQVLYDNGPLVTHPGGMTGAVAGDDRSAIGPGGTVFGSSVSQAAGFRIADRFVNDASWTITGLHLYVYQTASTTVPLTAPTLTGVTLRIWDGSPADPASQVIFGDTATNIMTAAFLTDIYRTTATDTTSIARRVQRAEISLPNLQLGAGTFYFDWSFSGSLASGPWQPAVSDPNMLVAGNGLQFNPAAPGTWGPTLDGPAGAQIQTAMPFTVIGVPTPGSLAILGMGALIAGRRRRN